MAQSRWLIMPVEVKHREFLSRVMLAAGAVSRGYRVVLGKDTMIRRLAPALPKGILFDKSLGTARHGKPQRFSKLGFKVVVLDEESTGYYGSPEQFLSVRLASQTLDACTRWYCISDQLRDHAEQLYPAHRERFLTTGLLRTDTWRSRFHDFYRTEVEQIRKQYGRFILFNSNFGGIIHARGDAFVQKQIRGQKKAYSAVEQRMATIFSQGRPNLDAYVDALPQIAEAFPSHRLVIRPHPSESPSFWKEKFANNDRISVADEGVVAPWILASEMLFHHGCTTGIEASILGRPNVMYAPFPDEHHDTEVMHDFVPVVKTESELHQAIRAGLEGSLPMKRPGSAWEQWYAGLSGALVADRILDDLDSITSRGGELPASLPWSVRTRLWMADRKQRSQKERAYMKQKWPGTSVEEISHALDVAGTGMGNDADFSVREVFPEVFEISASQSVAR